MDSQNLNKNMNRDEKLWKMAKRRTEFKKHLLTYLIINVFLWCLWFFTGAKYGNSFFPWPAFVTIGWGIGLAFNFVGAYTGLKDSLTEKEYNKLINKHTT
jgi:hypothetical protein